MRHCLHNSLRALFLSLAVLLSLPMLAVEVEIDGINYELNADARQATVVSKSGGCSCEVVIPESVEHEGTAYSVTSIASSAFENCSGLTSVTIPNSVTSIGDKAFSYCPGLTSVHISDIAAWCNIDFKENASNPLSHAHHLYVNGEEVKDLVIPNSVTSIGESAFYGCSGLTSVTIPNSVTGIGESAFSGCSGLTSVTIPNSVTSIGESAFSGCSGLTSVTIPNSVTSIENNAFYNCSGLTSVTIPNSVTSIGEEAFFGCLGLTSVTIPNSVTSIGDEAFGFCPGLTSVVVEDGNPVYDSRNNCKAIIETATNTLHSGCKTTIIPNSVTSIGYSAFKGCTGLTSVTIPNSVTSIGDYAFNGCSGLTSVTIPNSVESIGILAFCYCSGLTSVTIPNSVTSIGGDAFSFCSALTSVTIPNSVTSIGDYAFFGCSGLTSVTIPNSVTSIGNFAFCDCSGLTSVTIGNSVTSIGTSAFRDCSELLDVYCYAENVPSTGSNAFYGSYPEYATLHVPAASINSYRTTEPWSAFGTITSISGTVTPLPNITLTDGEKYENNIEQEVGTLTYTRTLPNMLWNPLYVPFKIPYEDLQENYEVAYINTMHSYDNDDNGEIDEMAMEIVKIKAGTLKPNHPYLIKAKNEDAKDMNIVQKNTTLYPAEITTLDCSSVYTKFEITGTYQEMTSGDLNGSLVISTDGAWKKLSSTSTLKPFRFYLTISSRESSPVEIADEAMSRVRIRVMGEDDNETGIDEVKTANDELKSEIYDLSGRRVSAPAKGGVYIVNGKKVIY